MSLHVNMYVCDQYGVFFGGRWKLYRTAEWISPVFRHIPMEWRNTCVLFFHVLSIHDYFCPLACFALATNSE